MPFCRSSCVPSTSDNLNFCQPIKAPLVEESLSKMLFTRSLLRIAQFGFIKAFPGLVNIALIPALYQLLGSEEFGHFSLFFSYVLLAVTVFGAIIAQPMYRFLSSKMNAGDLFNGLTVFAASFGALIGGLVGYAFFGGWNNSVAGFSFVMFGVLYSALTVNLQVSEKVRSLIFLEVLRISSLGLTIILLHYLVDGLSYTSVIYAFSFSFFLAFCFLLRGVKFTLPTWGWASDMIKFGSLSASWLLLAGLPLVLGKSVLVGEVSETEFGAISANLDMYYRMFSILNAAIAIWAYPTMSAAFDSGDRVGAKKTHFFALTVYIAAGATALALLVVGAAWYQPFPARISGGLLPFALILVACFLLQVMSLAHKPLEMSRSLITMIALMACALVVFGACALVLLNVETVNPAVAIAVALGSAALVYLIGSSAIGFGRSGKIEVADTA